MAAATMFTLLLWIYAEGENVGRHDLELTIRFVPRAGRDMLITPATVGPVQMTVRCATSQWTDIQELGRQPFDLPLSEEASPERIVDLAQTLRSDPRFIGRGMVVVDVRGAELKPRIVAEPLVSREVPVTVKAGALVLITGQTDVDPPRVTLRVPASEARWLDAAQVEAPLEGPDFDPARIPENVPQGPVLVPLRVLPANLRHTPLVPAQAKVRFTVLTPSETFQVPRLSVNVLMPEAQIGQFNVRLADEDRSLRDLQVTGPRDAIDRLRQGKAALRAVLVLTAEDLETGIAEKLVEVWGLPAGVTVTAPVPLPVLHFTVAPVGVRAPPPGPAGPGAAAPATDLPGAVTSGAPAGTAPPGP